MKKEKILNINILKTIFWILLGIFILIIVGMTLMGMDIMGIGRIIMISINFTLWILFFFLGIILIFLTIKLKIKGKLKAFLILTGASASGFLIGVILHNLVYALTMITSHIIILTNIFEIIHVAFFFLAIPICPIAFLVGIVGTIILLTKIRKKRKGKKKNK